MKTINIILLSMMSLLCITSCQDQNVKMTTIVNEDGTCRREVSYTSIMSKEMRDSLWGNSIGWAYPIPECLCVDSMMGSHTDTTHGDTITSIFYQIYGSAEEMSQHTPLRLNGVPIKSTAKLEKIRRWFYTDYTYTETFSSLGEKFRINPRKYADAETISYWFTGRPNILEGMNGAEASMKLNEIEPHITQWFNDNMTETVIDFIASHYDSIFNPPVSKREFVNLKDSLAKEYIKTGSDALTTEPQELFRSFFHSDAYSVFFDAETALGKELSSLLDSQLAPFLMYAQYTLKMPGEVTNTGFGKLQDGIIAYPFTGERLIAGDYSITATSRVYNYWAWIVSIIIILTAFICFWKYRK